MQTERERGERDAKRNQVETAPKRQTYRHMY